jgi:hypothetical protein
MLPRPSDTCKRITKAGSVGFTYTDTILKKLKIPATISAVTAAVTNSEDLALHRHCQMTDNVISFMVLKQDIIRNNFQKVIGDENIKFNSGDELVARR